MSAAHPTLQDLASKSPEDLWAATAAVAKELGWKCLMARAFAALGDSGSKHLWPTAIEVVTCGSDHPDALPGEVNECIARLHCCADTCDGLDTVEMDEQLWAFESKWLGLPYTSDWSPYSDPDVSSRMARMQAEG